MKYYWINLENADIRRNNILKDFSDNNITNHYRVNAYPSPIKHKRHYENACCRSHIQAMTHFLLDTNDEYGLICEDDLTFELKNRLLRNDPARRSQSFPPTHRRRRARGLPSESPRYCPYWRGHGSRSFRPRPA